MKTISENRISHIDLFYIALGAVLILSSCIAAFYSRMQFVLIPLPPILLIAYLLSAFGFMLIFRGSFPNYSGKKLFYAITTLFLFCSIAPYTSKKLGGKFSDYKQFAKNDSLKSIQEAYFISDTRIAVVNRHSYQVWDFVEGKKLFSIALTKIFGLRETFFDQDSNQVHLLNFKKELFVFDLKDNAKPEKISTKPKGFFLRNQKFTNKKYWPVKMSGLTNIHEKLIAQRNPELSSHFLNLANDHVSGYSLVYEEISSDQSHYIGVFHDGTILYGHDGQLKAIPKIDCGDNQHCAKGRSFAIFASKGEILRCKGDQLSTLSRKTFEELNRQKLEFPCLGLEKSKFQNKVLVFGDSQVLIQDLELGSNKFL